MPSPSWYTHVNAPTTYAARAYFPGETPTFTLNKSGADAYTVRDWYGAVLSTGAISGTSFTVTAPAGGWPCGWFRVYLTGPNVDNSAGGMGPAYGACNFVVVRDTSYMPDRMTQTAYTAEGVWTNESNVYGLKAFFGMAASRLIIADYAAITTTTDCLANMVQAARKGKAAWTQPTKAAFADAARPPRRMWCATPSRPVDRVELSGATGGSWLRIYALAATAAPSFAISVADGSIGGTKKLQVRTADGATVLETFDNLPTADAASQSINGRSTLVRAYSGGYGSEQAGPTGTVAASPCPTLRYGNVVTVVQTLRAEGVDYFEFTNEPGMNAEIVQQIKLFADTVHAADAAARAMGPCTVNMDQVEQFAALGGCQYVDEISFHDYDAGLDLIAGRSHIASMKAAIAAAGYSAKPLGQTEAGSAFTSVYGIYHPRRARHKVWHTLMWEQEGVPRERNTHWYDQTHGFWGFPAFWAHYDDMQPQAPLFRTLAEETFGRPFTQKLDLGPIANSMALASIYTAPGGASVVAAVAVSANTDWTLTLTISGAASTFTLVDAWGNETQVSRDTSGTVTIPVRDIPTYLRVPAGASIGVKTFNGWSSLITHGTPTRQADITVSGYRAAGLGDGALPTHYPALDAEMVRGAVLPSTATLTWPGGVRFDRVVVWTGHPWQIESALTDFDIQTSNNGVAWTTVATVTKPAASSFLFGGEYDAGGAGPCTRETYWDEAWVYDVTLPGGPVTTKYIRINARAGSYGGEPDAASTIVGGQGDGDSRLCINEVAVLCDANAGRQYLRA